MQTSPAQCAEFSTLDKRSDARVSDQNGLTSDAMRQDLRLQAVNVFIPMQVHLKTSRMIRD